MATRMRYRELLVCLGLVAVGIAASRSGPWDKGHRPPVSVIASSSDAAIIVSPTPASPQSSPGAEQVDIGSERVQKLRKEGRAEIERAAEQRWDGLNRSDFRLQLTITPASSWQQAEFEVVYQGPPGYEPVETIPNEGHPGYHLKVVEVPSLSLEVAEMPGWTFSVTPRRLGPQRWGFTGREMSSHFLEPKLYGFGESVEKSPPPLPPTTSWTVKVMTGDPRDLPQFSRGPNTLQVVSKSSKLHLR